LTIPETFDVESSRKNSVALLPSNNEESEISDNESEKEVN
jgi:hypothetical protein